MQKKFLVKSEEASLTAFGKYPGARAVEELLQNGTVVIDKPVGPTSRMVDSFVKKILNLNKLSHVSTTMKSIFNKAYKNKLKKWTEVNSLYN